MIKNKITFIEFLTDKTSYTPEEFKDKGILKKNNSELNNEIKGFSLEANDEDPNESLIENSSFIKSQVVANNEILNKYKRITLNDIDAINTEIEKMNKLGWTIKQIEGIQSGIFKKHIHLNPLIENGSYGFGFTEGILIVWERK